MVVARYGVDGDAQKRAIEKKLPFKQAGDFYRSLDDDQKTNLVSNLAGDLGQVTSADVKEIMVSHFFLADEDFGTRLSEKVGVDLTAVKGRAGKLQQAAAQ